jgi:hypothetical protein
VKPLRRWLSFAVAALCSVLGARAELRLPVFNAGTNTFTNAVITASSAGRVLVTHPHGFATVRVAELGLDQQQQLAAAGLLSKELTQQIEKQVAKRDAARRRAERPKMARPELNLEAIQKHSLASLLQQQAYWGADRIGCDPTIAALAEWLIEKYGKPTLLGICFGVLTLMIVRAFLFYRAVHHAAGKPSALDCVPCLRAFPLMSAAGLSWPWLLIPVFAGVTAFFPAPIIQQAPWATPAWVWLVLALWSGTAILRLVWAVKFCRAAEHSSALALLLVLPVVDFLALAVLAFVRGQKAPKAKPAPAPSKRPALAI